MTAWVLRYGRQTKPLVTVRPDAQWPSMWRLHWPDGSISDMVNLSRAKDAAMVLAMRTVPGNKPQLLHWMVDRAPAEPPTFAKSA